MHDCLLGQWMQCEWNSLQILIDFGLLYIRAL